MHELGHRTRAVEQASALWPPKCGGVTLWIQLENNLNCIVDRYEAPRVIRNLPSYVAHIFRDVVAVPSTNLTPFVVVLSKSTENTTSNVVIKSVHLRVPFAYVRNLRISTLSYLRQVSSRHGKGCANGLRPLPGSSLRSISKHKPIAISSNQIENTKRLTGNRGVYTPDINQ